MDTTDLKFADFECKQQGDDKAQFSGVLSTAEKDLHDDIIEAGAFGASLSNIPLLRDHNASKLIGKMTRFDQDGDKLRVDGTITLAEEVPVARETYALMKGGFLTGMSVGFRIKKGGATFDESTGVRRIKKAHLLEGSIVAIPANMGARVRGVKHALGSRDLMRDWLAEQGFAENEIDLAMRKGFDAFVRDAEELPNFLPHKTAAGGGDDHLQAALDELRGLRRAVKAEV
jgi:HK97 family phage prohead protease